MDLVNVFPGNVTLEDGRLMVRMPLPIPEEPGKQGAAWRNAQLGMVVIGSCHYVSGAIQIEVSVSYSTGIVDPRDAGSLSAAFFPIGSAIAATVVQRPALQILHLSSLVPINLFGPEFTSRRSHDLPPLRKTTRSNTIRISH